MTPEATVRCFGLRHRFAIDDENQKIKNNDKKKKGFQDAQSRDLNGLSGFRPRNAEKKKSGKKKLKSKLEKKKPKISSRRTRTTMPLPRKYEGNGMIS